MHRFVAAFLVVALVVSVATAQQVKPETPTWSVPADASFTAEDVSITREAKAGSDDVQFKIAGTLRIPTGRSPESGFPAVLFISGSGSQTRHGFQGNLDIGSWEFLDAIANAGFVVLATDDRGIGETPLGVEGKKPEDLGYLDLVGDAQAALDYLNSREEVNTSEVFLIGHSEGGLTAPILAGDNPKVAGVIFMAAAGRNMYDITLQQVDEAMASQPKAQRESNLKAQREFQDAVKEGREPDFNILGKAAAPLLKQSWKAGVLPIRKWWHEHFNLDVPAIHAKLKCPVFVANGKADFQVSPDGDARQIVKNLMEGECADVQLKIYDDLDHLFKPCSGKKSELKMYYENRRVSADFIKDVVRWLDEKASQ